jgi:predicted MarR family transcription regulator
VSKKADASAIEVWDPEPLGELQGLAEQISSLELALVVLTNSFYRWVDQCARAAGVGDLSTTDLLVSHFIILRRRPMTASALAFALSMPEVHPISYSAKKLVRLGLLKGKRNGKEVLFYPTAASLAQYKKYMQLRCAHLLRTIEVTRPAGQGLDSLTSQLRSLSGIYEQAARSIASV